MRWRQRHLTARDSLNIEVALAAQIEQGIARIKDAPRELEITLWAREVAGLITAYNHLTAPRRGRVPGRDQASWWAADLCAAITEAAARSGQL